MQMKIFILSSLILVLIALTAQIQAFNAPNKARACVPRATNTWHSSAIQDDLDQVNDEEKWDLPQSQADLLQQLDETSFAYEGRLPSGGKDFRCGFACIVGAPNMGKSTLMNALLQEDLCVATRRPQTTRHAILGVITTENRQLCLVDTPGVIDDPAYKLQEGMMEAVMGAFHDADILLVVTDIFSTPIPDDDLFEKVQKSRKPVIVVVNKVDLEWNVNKESAENEQEGRTVTVDEAVERWRSLLPEAMAIIPVSAEEGVNQKGVTALRTLLLGGDDVPAAFRDLGRPIQGMFPEGVRSIKSEDAKNLLPLGPPLYDEDTLTDRSERFFASEIIRASLFRKLNKELPYCCEVRITQFREPKSVDKKKLIRIEANVLVERDSQKIIVVGKGGEVIKAVGIDAREKLEEFLQMQVMLQLNVKVEKDWRKNEKLLRKFGYFKG
jgi:GTP-binding protein Era